MEMKKKKEYEKKVLSQIQEKWRFIRDEDGGKTPVNIMIHNQYTTCYARN